VCGKPHCGSETVYLTLTQCGFRQQFQRRDAPSRNSLLLWVSKWCQEEPVTDSKPQGRPHSAHTPDKLERVRNAILRSPRRSRTSHRLKDSSLRRILHLYKIHVAQELSERDEVS
jgi:hypothetical protein